MNHSTDRPARFPTTMWTVLREAREGDSPAALEPLFAAYWRPIYSVLRLAWNQNHNNAKDLTQAFFLSLLERSFAEHVDPRKGRFRDLLKAALKNFMLTHKRDAARLKRGGHVKFASIEELPLEPPSSVNSPEKLFDQMWVRNLVARAIESAEERLGRKDRSFWIEALRSVALEDSLEGKSTYRQAASELGVSEGDFKKGLEAARRALRSAILREIRQYAGTELEVQEELAALFESP